MDGVLACIHLSNEVRNSNEEHEQEKQQLAMSAHQASRIDEYCTNGWYHFFMQLVASHFAIGTTNLIRKCSSHPCIVNVKEAAPKGFKGFHEIRCQQRVHYNETHWRTKCCFPVECTRCSMGKEPMWELVVPSEALLWDFKRDCENGLPWFPSSTLVHGLRLTS